MAALFGVLAGVSVMEAGLVHLVVMRWSAAAAWGLTAISAYGTVWLVAMARAFVLRPVLVESGELVVRGGMMWTLRVPLVIVEDAECGLRLPLFSAAVTARGMYGMTKRVRSVGLAMDDRAGFVGSLGPSCARMAD